MEEFRRLNDRQIEQLIELWRQEECLWKVTNKNYLDIDSRKTARLEFTLAVPITILYNYRLSTCNNNICLLPMGTSIRFRVTVLLTV